MTKSRFQFDFSGIEIPQDQLNWVQKQLTALEQKAPFKSSIRLKIESGKKGNFGKIQVQSSSGLFESEAQNKNWRAAVEQMTTSIADQLKVWYKSRQF